ncbi:hypothetical protein C7377_1710 [Balneicella halophila]|uniref:DUF5683 domain-containing protein n=1 Tax=Balneicella halophila TaxID=1537566 RepID=A0A7L4UNE5_BALHA|nr:DUF5683 domain-containing protein [Balneicella halophila]PVX50062.1 hypothetical protein C7377_1710 [Balneicella halophila]
MRGVFLLVISLLSASYLFGQDVYVSPELADTTRYSLQAQDTVVVNNRKVHSPKRATIYEALVPGLGHIYNKKYWNLPFTYTGFGVTIFFIIDNTKKYEKYRNAYEDFAHYQKYLTQSPQYPLPIPEPESQRFRKVLDVDYSRFNSKQIETFQKALKNNKDRFRRYRDLSYISLVGVYILNVIWAATDAHFFNYDVSDDLSMQLQPQMLVMQDFKSGVGLNIVINF